MCVELCLFFHIFWKYIFKNIKVTFYYSLRENMAHQLKIKEDW